MSDLAVIELGGKRHLVKDGAVLTVNRLTNQVDELIERPNLIGSNKVTLKVKEHILGQKVGGVKFKSKARVLLRFGHRQHQTVLEVQTPRVSTETKTTAKPKAVSKKS